MSKQEELLILALRKALESPDGLEMLTRKGVLGLFPNSPAGKQAAQSALNQGWLQKKVTTQSLRVSPFALHAMVLNGSWNP